MSTTSVREPAWIANLAHQVDLFRTAAIEGGKLMAAELEDLLREARAIGGDTPEEFEARRFQLEMSATWAPPQVVAAHAATMIPLPHDSLDLDF